MKKILFIPFFLLMTGCIDTQKQQVPLDEVENSRLDTNITDINSSDENITEVVSIEENQTVLLPQTAYLPFISSVGEREHITLYKTDGTVAGTTFVYEANSFGTEDFNYHIFKNFTIFGEYIYYDFVKEKYTFDTSFIGQLRTNIKNDETTESMEIEASENNHPRINRVIVNDTLYIKTLNDNFYASLFKYSSDGEYINLNATQEHIDFTNSPMVNLNDNLYMVASRSLTKGYNLVEWFSDDSFNTYMLNSDLENIQLYGMEENIYILAKNSQMRQYELWRYNTMPKESPTRVYSFSEIPYGVSLSNGAGYVGGEKLYIVAPQKDGVDLLSFDSHTSQVSRLLSGDSIGEFITYKDKTLFIADKTLWQSDGTVDGTIQLLDRSNNPLNAKELTVIGDRLYFSSDTALYGEELWSYDGNSSNLLVDINQGEGGSFPTYITKLNGGIVFQATSDGKHNQLFFYDGNLTILK